MPKIAFTDRWLRNLKPKTRQDEFTDATCPNLRLRVTRNAKSFSVMVGDPGSRRRVTLGKYPALQLAEARRKAGQTTSNPIVKKVARKESRFGTVKDLFEFVIASMEEEGKDPEANRIYLLTGPNAAVHAFGDATLARNVRPADVTQWLRDIHLAGIKTQHPRAYLSAAFGRGILADNDPTKDVGDVVYGIDANPVVNVGGGGSSSARDRMLPLDELKTFWRDFPASTSAQTATAVRMIIAMGGARITEIVCSRKTWWTEQKKPWLNIPKTKNATSHSLPLSQAAINQLSIARSLSDPDSDYLFPHRFDPEQSLTPNSLGQAIRRYCDDAELERFQTRDLRRTMKSHLLDADDDLREEWLDIWHNHGRNADVARKHYDRAEYKRAKQKVANAIDRVLEKIIT